MSMISKSRLELELRLEKVETRMCLRIGSLSSIMEEGILFRKPLKEKLKNEEITTLLRLLV